MSIYNDVLPIEKMLEESFDPETGEILEADEKAAEQLKAEIMQVGLEKLCKVRANIMSDIDGLKAEKKRIDDRIKSQNSSLERLENYILAIHKLSGQSKSTAGSFTISTRLSTSVQVDDSFDNKDYIIVEEVKKVDKIALKQALQSGATVIGAQLVKKENLQVK